MAAISILISVLSASFKAPFQGCATKLGCKVKHLFPLYQDFFTLFHYTSHILTHFCVLLAFALDADGGFAFAEGKNMPISIR